MKDDSNTQLDTIQDLAKQLGKGTQMTLIQQLEKKVHHARINYNAWPTHNNWSALNKVETELRRLNNDYHTD